MEATCEEGGGFAFPNEIIEFPVVLVDGKTFDIVRHEFDLCTKEGTVILSFTTLGG